MKGGEYAGERYFEKETVEEFTKCQFCEDENRRGASSSSRARGRACPIVVHHNSFWSFWLYQTLA